jgi:hypothetical protein
MKSDLHIHTSFSSDGISSPQKIVKAAMEKGLDCIAITDHNTTKGIKEATSAAFDHSLLVVPGIEVSSRDGHILGLNVKRDVPAGLSAEETIRIIKEQNGTVVIPHPFHIWMNFKNLFRLFKVIDAVEIFNARILNSANRKALEFVFYNNFSFTLGSDAHRKGTVGRACMRTEGVNSRWELAEKIMAGEVEAGERNLNALERMWKRSGIEMTETRDVFGWKSKLLKGKEKGSC